MVRLFRLRALIALAAILAYALPHWAIHAGAWAGDGASVALDGAAICGMSAPGAAPAGDGSVPFGDPGGNFAKLFKCPICGSGAWLTAAFVDPPPPPVYAQPRTLAVVARVWVRPPWPGAAARAPPGRWDSLA